nr:hypothetical protein BgiMline_005595 [Biomphalaria glabrata]
MFRLIKASSAVLFKVPPGELSDRKDLSDVTELSDRKDLSDVTELSDRKDLSDVTELSDRKDLSDVTELSDRKDLSDSVRHERNFIVIFIVLQETSLSYSLSSRKLHCPIHCPPGNFIVVSSTIFTVPELFFLFSTYMHPIGRDWNSSHFI